MLIANTCARWVGLATALLCAGCATTPSIKGTAPPPSGGGSGTGATAPRLIGSAAIDGAYKAAGTFSTRPEVLVGSLPAAPSAHDTCTDYANGFAQHPTSFVPPAVKTSGTPTLYLTTTLASGYHGPGTYTSATSPMLRGQVAVGVGDVGDLNGAGFIDTFRSGYPGTTTLTVHDDGSGMLQFSGWGSDATIISGTVQWVCH
ncbi:MAG TPA: hypothetical protein VI434_14640 [Candidatus Dormibacteraeota bacterium]